MSTTVQELIRSSAATVASDVKRNFMTISKNSMAQNEANTKILDAIVGWLDMAIKQTVDGAAALNVPIAGGAAPNGLGGGNALSGFVANVGPQSQPGFAPQQQQQFGFPQQPQGGNVQPPKDSKLSLAECGVARVPNHIANPGGAKCGVAHTSNQCPGVTLYCDKPAVKQGTCGSWTCNGHAKRETADAKGKGGKKSGGNSVTSAQQIVGLNSATFMPQGFGRNPGMVDNVTGLMQQQPQAPTPFAQFGQQQPANPAMANQLTNSLQQQIGAIPQNNTPLPPNGGFNFNTVLQNPAPSAVAINPAFGGIPSTPLAPPQNGQATGFAGFVPQNNSLGGGLQQTPAPIGFGSFGQFIPGAAPVNIQPQSTPVQGFVEEDDGGSSDDDSSSEGEAVSTPIPVVDKARLAEVNQAAFGQPAAGAQSSPAPAATNPLANALAAQQAQVVSPAPVPEVNPLFAMVNAAQPK